MIIRAEDDSWDIGDFVFLILLLCVPTTLIIGTQILYGHIAESEAIAVVAHFRGYRETEAGRLLIQFSDHDPLKLYWDRRDKVETELDKLEDGASLTMQIHPRSHIIMSLYHGDTELLAFETTLQNMKTERTGFLWYAIAFFAIIAGLFLPGLIDDLKNKHKQKNRPKDGFIIKKG